MGEKFNCYLQGLSHEIDFKNVDENGHILALLRAAAGFWIFRRLLWFLVEIKHQFPGSVADLGCLSRIPSQTFFHPGSRIRTVSIPDPGSSSKNLSILTPKKAKKWFLSSSVADPWHFGVDPDPRIHASDWWIQIRIRIRILDPDPSIFVTDLPDASKKVIFLHNFFCLWLFEATFTSFFKDKNSKRVIK